MVHIWSNYLVGKSYILLRSLRNSSYLPQDNINHYINQQNIPT